tara:strand:+ start:3356 stop:3574 length:219 start_codon:yes stop_codon:yes gene_type:complete
VKESVKQLAEVVTSNPKIGLFVATMTTIETWWIDWGNPLVDACASILGVVLLIVLIRKHWYSTDTNNSNKQG